MGADDDGGDKGLDAAGLIRREGSLERVRPVFWPLIEDLDARVHSAFGERFNGLYVYGSIPRGNARVGSSDLDAMAVVIREQDADRAVLSGIEAELDRAYDVIDGVGIVLGVRSELLAPTEQYGWGFFTACLCTWFTGEDLTPLLPAYRPTVELAAGVNRDYRSRLAAVRRDLASGADPIRICRFARQIVRTAFCLVMPRWGGWTSDFSTMVKAFGRWYPAQAAELSRIAGLAREPSPDRRVVEEMLDGFGTWLGAEYETTILAASC